MRKKYNANDVAVIIPALNPDLRLEKYIAELIDAGFEKIVVINDGSREELKYIFANIEKNKEVTVINHEVNKGKGCALKTGFGYCLENNWDIAGVITADSDGQHSSVDTWNTAEKLCENSEKIILGTRNFNEQQVPAKSKYGNKITTVAFKILYGKYVNDTQTGLRGIGIKYLKQMCTLKGERFEYEIKVLIYAAKEKIDLIEVPIETIYIYDNKETHFNPIKDSLKIYGVLFSSFIKYAVSAGSSFLIDIGLFTFFTTYALKNYSPEINILISTVLARVVSSIYNFSLNHKIVFNSKNNLFKNAIGYYALAIVQMCCSAGFVFLLSQFLKLNSVFAKAIVDTILFLISFQIQQRFIFSKKI